MRVVVAGAGVSGLMAALALGRRGHDVTVVERDATPFPADAASAFWWDRRGAPQVRHSHALLALLHNLLRDHYPDVLDDLFRAGATPIRLADILPATIEDRSALPGDDDLTMIACRRTTFEWVLRRTVMRAHGVRVLDGRAAEGLAHVPGGPAGPPTVNGLLLDGAEVLPADVVVVANGRRSALPDWLGAIGAGGVPEEVEDTGIVYYSRFYRLRDGADLPQRDGPVGGDLGYLKYAVFLGDNRTFSVTLATASDDDDLRRRLAGEPDFDTTAALLPATTRWVEPDRAEPITGVHVMAGLLNRRRSFVLDGHPVALGLFVVGDAAICSNPLYGRGCALAAAHAHALAEVLDAPVVDPVAAALAFDEATSAQLVPWYLATVRQDAQARKVAAALLRGEDPDADTTDPDAFGRRLLRDGLAPATRTDPVVFRAFMRNLNLLSAPDALLRDQDLIARVWRSWEQRDSRPPEPVLGPPRPDLLAVLDAA